MDVNDNVREALVVAQEHMNAGLEAVRREFQNIRTGRANISILDDIQVDYYGTATPLNQLANLSSPDAQLLLVQPYDKAAIGDIERAIHAAELGLNANNDGQVARRDVVQICAAVMCESNSAALRTLRPSDSSQKGAGRRRARAGYLRGNCHHDKQLLREVGGPFSGSECRARATTPVLASSE